MREVFGLVRGHSRSQKSDAQSARLRVLRHFAAIFLAAIMLSWPIAVNRGPFFLSDSTSYIRGADAAFYKLTAMPTDWSDRYVEGYGEPQRRHGLNATSAKPENAPVTLSGRSIYYGFFLYLSDRVAGLPLAAFVQALLTALCLYLSFARFRSRDVMVEFLVVAAILSTASGVAYFAAYLMPDIFTGLGLLAAAHLLTKSPPLSPLGKAFWFALMSLSALFHTANLLILTVVLAVTCAIPRTRRIASRMGIWLVCASLLIALMGELAFYGAVDHFTGDPPVRPPFLTARLVADGPGKDYLKETCPKSGFALCEHLGSIADTSDDFLWSEHPYNGVFSVVPSNERRRIAAEESRFVMSVVFDRPWQVLRSSALSIWRQCLMWRLPEFNLSPKQDNELAAKLPSRVETEQSETRAFSGTMPVALVDALALPVALVSLCFVIWASLRHQIKEEPTVFIAVLLIGVAADVAICGAISTPHDRYIMRAAWLLPFAALVIRPMIHSRLPADLAPSPAGAPNRVRNAPSGTRSASRGR